MRGRRRLLWGALLTAVVVALVVASGSGETPEERASQSDRVGRLSSQLRCPTCQGLSVADSPSSTARAIRDDVARRVAEGETDDEVKQAYVDRYGEWILLRPRSSGLGALLWALPGAALVAAVLGLGLTFRRWRREPMLTATDDDKRLVERARAEWEGG